MVVVELPAETEAWALAKAKDEGFLSLSDYVAALVQQQQDAAKLRVMLQVGDPIPATAFDDAFFADLDRIATGAL